MISCKYLFLGHHKCSSTYVKNIFSDIAAVLNLKLKELNTSEELSGVGTLETDVFLLLNANADLASKNFKSFESIKCVHVVRDPRDIIVSAYYSHLKSHPTDQWPELIPHREQLLKLDKKPGLIAEMDFSGNFLNDMRSWRNVNSNNILHIKMEDFTHDAYSVWVSILNFMGLLDDRAQIRSFKRLTNRFAFQLVNRFLPITNWMDKKLILPEALEIVYRNRFEAQTKGRKLGEEDVSHHYRKGIPGDWRNHFNDELKSIFKEKYNDLLLQYNYEQDDSW